MIKNLLGTHLKDLGSSFQTRASASNRGFFGQLVENIRNEFSKNKEMKVFQRIFNWHTVSMLDFGRKV